MKKLVSVVIPTYNRESTILKAINSVLCQNYDNVEILVCDDFSTDNTREMVKTLEEKYSNIKFISRKDGRKGANAARNAGIQAAQGEYIAFLDSDDTLTVGSISARITAFEENPDVDMVYGDVNVGGKVCYYDKMQNYNQRKYLMKELSLCCFSVVMIKRSVFETVPLLDEKLKSWQDDGLVLSLDNYNKKMFHCDLIVSEMGVSEESITKSKRNLYEGCKRTVSLYKKSIVREASILRYGLWKARIFLDWLKAKEQMTKIKPLKWFCEKMYQFFLMLLKPFFRHIWG